MTSASLCQQIVSNYIRELEGDFEVTESNAGCFIATPFVRPDGEYIEFEVIKDPSGGVRITDMGDTLNYLFANGLTLSRSTLESAKDICKQFDVSLIRSELVANVGQEFGEVFHRVTQATISVTGLIQKRRPNPRVNFADEVESLIIVSGSTYDIGFPVQGARNNYNVKFHVNSGRNMLIQPIAASTEATAMSWAERWAFRVSDIREYDTRWQFIAMLDDRSQRREIWHSRTIAPLREYAITWTEREKLLQLLTHEAPNLTQ